MTPMKTTKLHNAIRDMLFALTMTQTIRTANLAALKTVSR